MRREFRRFEPHFFPSVRVLGRSPSRPRRAHRPGQPRIPITAVARGVRKVRSCNRLAAGAIVGARQLVRVWPASRSPCQPRAAARTSVGDASGPSRTTRKQVAVEARCGQRPLARNSIDIIVGALGTSCVLLFVRRGCSTCCRSPPVVKPTASVGKKHKQPPGEGVGGAHQGDGGKSTRAGEKPKPRRRGCQRWTCIFTLTRAPRRPLSAACIGPCQEIPVGAAGVSCRACRAVADD